MINQPNGIKLFIVLLLLANVACGEDAKLDRSPVPDVTLTEVRKGIATLHDALSKLNSWELDGELRVTTAEEFLDMLSHENTIDRDEAKLGEYKIHEARQGSLWSVRRDRFSDGKVVVSSESIYVGNGSVIYKQTGEERSASIIPRDKVPLYADSMMLIYCFLNPTLGSEGIPLLDPAILAAPEGWQAILAALPSAQLTEAGTVRVRLEKPNCIVVVDFSKASDASQRWPSQVSVFTKSNHVLAEITVDDFFSNRIGMPRTTHLKTFLAAKKTDRSVLMATWEYQFSGLRINCPVKEEAVTFDPASVDTIWDEANQTFFTVPR